MVPPNDYSIFKFNSTPSLIVGSCLVSSLSFCSIQQAFIEHWQSAMHIALETWVEDAKITPI